ncbi:Retrovirus-related Pol polyprotein from transposon gypsy [Smittium culicis]|uniref:Retrovirus-related Pol polyprotein from transposon gypsy n=1 Tax=Smittium culicis TaxID=133412 RepID=A0A1R1YTQ1_9FUNG|nr:Retrovirus-related Pol polyprotein from transposon gypsy [Smittium culicis]
MSRIPTVGFVLKGKKTKAGGSPMIEAFSEDFSGRQIYSSFDLLSGYDQIPLAEKSRDIFGILTPFGLLRMTRLPMWWSNSVQVFQRLMYKIFMRHIPDKMGIFLDDGCIKDDRERDSNCDIPGVRNFVANHVKDVVDILGTMIDSGLTMSGKKCRKTTLRLPDYKDPNRPLKLTVDASSVGAGAVLQQSDKEGNMYAIRCESYTFNGRERRYA